jgi:hypothetical protein
MPWRVEVKEDPGGLLLQEILSLTKPLLCTTDMPWRVEVKEDPGGLLLQGILSSN